MSIVIQPRRPPAMRRGEGQRPPARPGGGTRPARPVVAAVDGSAAGRAAAAEAIAAARELGAPIVLVYVRRGPSPVWGKPFYERRLEQSLRRARQALAAAAAEVRAAGAEAETEILEGRPARRIAEFARDRNARLVIVGPRRRRARARVFRTVAGAGLPVVRARRV